MNRKTYLSLRKKLIALAEECQTSVTFRKKTFKRNAFGVSGIYSSVNHKIVISYSGNCSYSELLAVLAHEVRHAQHFAQGLFKEYYNPELYSKEGMRQIAQGEKELPNLDVCLAAENDCNAFAIEWMAKAGFPLDSTKATYQDFFRPYSHYSVPIYQLARTLPREKYQAWHRLNFNENNHLLYQENLYEKTSTPN